MKAFRFYSVVASILAGSISSRNKPKPSLSHSWKSLPVILLAGISVFAQTNPNLESGVHNFGSYDGGDVDLVNLVHGGASFKIPLVSYPQRGGMPPVEYFFQDTGKKWALALMQVPVSNGTSYNVVYPWIGAAPVIGSGIGINNSINVTVGRTRMVTRSDSQDPTSVTSEQDFNYWVGTPDGSVHNLDGLRNNATVMLSVDTSGFQFILTVGVKADHSDDSGVLIDRNGTRYFYPKLSVLAGNTVSTNVFMKGYQFTNTTSDPNTVTTYNDVGTATSVTDANGNILSPGVGPTGIDTLGRSTFVNSPAATSDYSGCSNSRTITSAAILNYPGPNGGTYPVKLCYASVTIATAFSQPSNALQYPNSFDTGAWSMVVSIVLPDKSSWSLDYDSYGNITSIIYPTGGSVSYQWQEIAMPFCDDGSNTLVSRAVKSRTRSDGTNSANWQYSWGTRQSDGTITNIVTDPVGNDTAHVMSPIATPCGFYETETRYYQGSHSSGTLLKTVDTTYSGSVGSLNFIATNVVPLTITTTLANGKVSQVTRQYDSGIPSSGVTIFGDITLETESDWGQGGPGAVLRQTSKTYQWQADTTGNYLNSGLLDLTASVVIKDGSGNRLAETDSTYDESQYLTASNISTQHGAPPNSVRGNLTTISKWLNNGNPVVTHTNWYDTGEVFQQLDALQHATTHSYDPYYVGAYSTKTCNALSQCVSGTYDFNTGVLTSFTNANATQQASGNTPGDSAHTTTYSYDLMSRLTTATFPPDPSNNGAQAQTTFQYPNPISLPFTVTRAHSVTPTLTDSVTSTYDGLGRVYKTQHPLPNGTAEVDTTYDGLDHVVSVTNPYFSTSDPTYGEIQMQYDALGRVTQTKKQDGSITSAQYDQTSSTSLNGDCTISTDEAGKSRKDCLDGLGRLIEVDEPQASSGSLTNPYLTLYAYDALGDLLSVNQEGDGSQAARMRKFAYDSLSRLLTATNPESGTISYDYDANSNVLQKTSPAPNQTGTATQTVSYCYDPLNRVTGKAYSAQACPLSSPVVSYGYDAGTNSIGHLTSLSDQAGSGSYSYDALGRITTEQRTIAGIQKALRYGYNLDNSIATLTYPSGAVVAYTPDSAGRMLSAVDNGNNINYVTGASYGPDSSLTGFASGPGSSFAGIANSFSYNSRLQPVNMSAVSPGTRGTSATASVTIGGSMATASSTTGTPPPNAASGSALTGYEDSSFVNHWIYEGSNQHLYEFSWNSSSGGSSYLDATAEAGSVLAASNSALSNYLDTNQNPHWVYEDGSQNLQFLAYEVQGRTWLSLDVNSLAGSPVAASASPLTSKEDSNCQQEWAYFGSNQHLVEAYAVGNGSTGCLGNDVWNFSDGTAASNAPAAASGSALSVYFDNNQIPEWIYEDANQHVQLLAHEPSGSWFNLDITNTAGSPVAAPGSALTSREDTNCMQHWAYFGTNQHLYQIHAQGNAGGGCSGNDVWAYSDLTAATGAPAAAPGSAMSMYFDTNQLAHWIYEDSAGHIQLLWWNPGGVGNVDVTATANSPVAAPGSALGSYEDANCMQHWFYFGSNQHLYEVRAQGNAGGGCAGNDVWTYADITAATSGIALDSGTVSLNVGDFTATACFGSSSNPSCSGQAVNTTTAQVAAALAQALNASNSPVTASVSGSTITLAGKNNVVFDAGIDALNTVHDNPSLFPNPSFTSPATGFTGGSSANLPVFNITYNFNLGNGDNGNVVGITNNRDNTRSQSFTYDALNRLTSAQNAGTNCSATTPAGAPEYWGNSYGYDAWGNLLSKTVTKCSAENLSVTALANNQLSGYGYDAAGNMTHDATTDNNYTFDPENRITGAAGYSYTYDADGNRVKKSNGSTGTIYWSMTPGIVAESDLSGNLTSEYVFFNSERIARKDFSGSTTSVSYYFADHLKTASVITDSAGNIKEDEDYYPWGGEVPFVNSDLNHYKFTSKERDSETGLDYFGARYYGNWLGRWMSPDWTGKPEPVPYATLADPQTLNLYSYTRNVPTVLIDDDGHGLGTPDWTSDQAKQRIAQEANLPEKEQLKRMAIGACVVFCGPAAAMGGVEAAPLVRALVGLGLAYGVTPGGQQLLNGTAEAISNPLPTPSLTGAFGISKVETTLEGFAVGRLANGAEVAARITTADENTTVAVLGAFNAGGPKSVAGTINAIESGAQTAAQQAGSSQVTIQAVGVINKKLADFLTKNGFTKTTVKVGKEEVNAYQKTFQVKQPGQ